MFSARMSYEFFDHTADVGVRVRGGTLAELFQHAAAALTELLIERSPVAPQQARAVALDAASVDGLLRGWLTELLVWFDAERFVMASVAFDELSETRLRARVEGEQFDPAKHAAGVEVKGVTRHQFRVAQAPGGWEAELIVDV